MEPFARVEAEGRKSWFCIPRVITSYERRRPGCAVAFWVAENSLRKSRGRLGLLGVVQQDPTYTPTLIASYLKTSTNHGTTAGGRAHEK